MGNYWTATGDFLSGNPAPNCPACGQPMAAEDDHGRFRCLSCWMGNDVVTGLTSIRPQLIPQADTTGMTDAQKAKVPAINRLHAKPTAAEAKLFDLLLKGADAMDGPEYAAAREAVEQERE